MADTRYLQQRGKMWFIRVPKPPAEWGFGGREFVASLGISDLTVARSIRDRYLLPLIAATRARRMLATLSGLVAQADEEIADRARGLQADLTGIEPKVLTLRVACDNYLDHLSVSGGYTLGSLSRYRSALDSGCRILGGAMDVETLSKADAIHLRDTLLCLPIGWQRRRGRPTRAKPGKRRLSAGTVAYVLMMISRVFEWLLVEGRVQRSDNPFRRIAVAKVVQKHKRCPEVPRWIR